MILECVEEHGRVRKGKLYETFVKYPKYGKQMSKQTLYDTLERLEENKEVTKINIPKGKKKRIFYELPIVETMRRAQIFIENYKIKNENKNPKLEEVAIEIGVTPEKVREAVYPIAKEVGWSESDLQPKSRMFSQELDKQEIKLILNNLKNNDTQDSAAKYLHRLSWRQELIDFPNFLSIITEILSKPVNKKAIEEILQSMYFVIISPSFKEKINERNIKSQLSLFCDQLVKIIEDSDYQDNPKQQAIKLLGILKDERLIKIIIDSLKNIKEENDFQFKNVFNNWLFSKFFKRYKLKLLKELFELEKYNKSGANILVTILTESLEYE